MPHQTETINSNGHAHVKQEFQKYYFYDDNVWYERQNPSIIFFKEKKSAVLNDAYIPCLTNVADAAFTAYFVHNFTLPVE